MKWFDNLKAKSEQDKNKKLTGNIIRIKINRLINGTPIEIGIFNAELIRDENNNTVILDEKNKFKEEMPGIQDSLVSDILYKLESRSSSIKEQLIKVEKAIKTQEIILTSEKNGYIQKESKSNTANKINIKINQQTEKSKLRLLKCIKYTLDNKKGDGFYESIDIDGTRTLTYLIRDGDLIPYWFKTPDSNGEPVILVPDIVQRKKFWKEATDETIQDFNENLDNMWKGWLGFLTKGLFVVLLFGLMFWTFHNARWSSELYDESLTPQIQELQVENERIRQACSNQLASQIENNGILIDYAKTTIQRDIESIPNNQNKSNIQI